MSLGTNLVVSSFRLTRGATFLGSYQGTTDVYRPRDAQVDLLMVEYRGKVVEIRQFHYRGDTSHLLMVTIEGVPFKKMNMVDIEELDRYIEENT